MKEFDFKTFGSEKKHIDPAGIHVLIPYCLKSPVCPFGRFNDECRSGCGLCDVETIVSWAKNNNYHYCVTRGSVFYESYLPKYLDSMEILISFSCSAGFVEDEIQKLINEYNFSFIFVEMMLTCKTDGLEAAKDGKTKLQNFVEQLEQKLYTIEEYLNDNSQHGHKTTKQSKANVASSKDIA